MENHPSQNQKRNSQDFCFENFQPLPVEEVDPAGEAEDAEMESELLSTPSILSLKLLTLTKCQYYNIVTSSLTLPLK
jgi:hypothetical protein